MAERAFLFGDKNIVGSDEAALAQQFVTEMTRPSINPEVCRNLGADVLTVVSNKLHLLSDDELLRYSERGRGADFSGVRLFFDPEAQDFLRLHVYPRFTTDGGYHRHSRRIVSNLQHGGLVNHEASAEFCDPSQGDGSLEVWDCKIVENRCTPAVNNTVGARLSEKGSDKVDTGSTYEVPTEVYHTITVEPGTATLCLFTESGMCGEPVTEGRLIKPRQAPLEPILPMDYQAIREIREAVQ